MKEFFIKMREADIRNIIAVITSIGSFGLMGYLISKGIPTENHDIVVAGIGYMLGGANGAVYGYLFSASRADKKQSEQQPGTKT